jgi:hypothetical protein
VAASRVAAASARLGGIATGHNGCRPTAASASATTINIASKAGGTVAATHRELAATSFGSVRMVVKVPLERKRIQPEVGDAEPQRPLLQRIHDRRDDGILL